MSNNIVDIVAQQETILQYRYNPANISRAAFQTLTDIRDGSLTMVDPSNPLAFGVVFTASAVAAFMQQNEVLTRKQYAVMAQNLDDLYHHMSDTDYINRFATPTTANITLYLPYQDVLAGLVNDPDTGDSRIVIPGNSTFTVAGVPFSLQYPIIIRKLSSGALQALYDTSVPSPLQTIDSNTIDINYSQQSSTATTYLLITFEVTQFAVTSSTMAVSASSLFQYTLPYTDQFYFARAYIQKTDGTWQEIKTTHSDLVYDPNIVTAVLSVLTNNQLQVRLPQVYTASGNLTSTLRVDIYTTKGALAMSLGDYQADQWSLVFQNLDKSDPFTYSAPLKSFNSLIYAISTDTINGGSNGKSFATLQAEVIDNSTGANKQPISRLNVADALADAGYSIVTDVDNVTNRTFLATRALPDPTNSTLITAAGTAIGTVTFSFNDIAGRSYVIDHSPDNHNALTITPDARYQDVNGVVGLVSDAALTALDALTPDQKALQVTAGKYYYTPFHYVLNMGTTGLTVKPYYLDGPTWNNKVFLEANKFTQVTVETAAYALNRTTTGYQLVIQTSSDDNFKKLTDAQVYVQLAVTPKGETERAYINGVLSGTTSAGERQYTFDLSTNFYLDTDNYLALTKMFMFTTNAIETYVNLNSVFDIIWFTSAPQPSNWQKNTTDTLIARFLIGQITVYALTHEQVNLGFGVALDQLWARARSLVTAQSFQTYTQNIPAYYTEDVYQRDPLTGSIVTFVNGQPTYTLLYKKGDPELNPDGSPIYAHKIGDIMLDAANRPILVQDRNLQHQIDFVLIEGVYAYATDAASVTYRAQMISTIVTWLTTDLEALAENLLENSNIWFAPKKTVGNALVLYGQGQTVTIDMGQSISLTLYVSKAVYNNPILRSTLQDASIQTVSVGLNTVSVARSDLIDALRTVYAGDVKDIELSGLGGSLNLDLFTLLDNSIRPSLRKRLIAQADGSLIVEEDLTVNFVLHDVSSIA